MKKPKNKQASALKQLLETQTEEKKGKAHSDVSLLEIAEDLLCNDPTKYQDSNLTRTVSFGKDNTQETPCPNQPLKQSIELFNALITKEAGKAANELNIEAQELKAWIDLQIEVPAKTILSLLRTMQNLHLDPLNEEIGFTQYGDGAWQVFITIEGCAKLLNQHSQFDGLVFNQANTLIDGAPEWIECSIYRKDRVMPTTVREYLTEVRGEHSIWQKMPRRMLRHKALQQCVRLAIA